MKYFIPIFLLAVWSSAGSSGADNICKEHGQLLRGYRDLSNEYASKKFKQNHEEENDGYAQIHNKSSKAPAAESFNDANRNNSPLSNSGYDGIQQDTIVDTSVYPSNSRQQNNLQTSNLYRLFPALMDYRGFNLLPSMNSFTNPQSGNFLLGNTVVTSTRPAEVSRSYTRNKVGRTKPIVTTQDFASLFQSNNQPYSHLYSPSSQQFSFTNPSLLTVKPNNYVQPNYQLNYGFGYPSHSNPSLPTLQTSNPQLYDTNESGDKKASSSNNKNGQYPVLYSGFTPSNPLVYNAPFTNPYSGNILNGNAFPTLTAHGFQTSPNNLVNSAALAPFSSGIYHSQPSYTNQFFPQNQFPLTNANNNFQPQSASITTSRPKVSPVKEIHDETTEKSNEDDHPHEKDSSYKYDSDDDEHYHKSQSSSDYSEEDDGDSSDTSSEAAVDSPFPGRKEFLKTSQSVGKSSYPYNSDQESGPDELRGFGIEDFFKSSPKEYYSSSFHSEEPFGTGEPSGDHESREKYEYTYKPKKPSKYGKKNTYGKFKTSSPYKYEGSDRKPGTFRTYDPKKATGYSYDRYAPGRYGKPGDYDDSEVQHSEYRPQSLNKEVTKEDKAHDYYRYSVITHKHS